MVVIVSNWRHWYFRRIGKWSITSIDDPVFKYLAIIWLIVRSIVPVSNARATKARDISSKKQKVFTTMGYHKLLFMHFTRNHSSARCTIFNFISKQNYQLIISTILVVLVLNTWPTRPSIVVLYFFVEKSIFTNDPTEARFVVRRQIKRRTANCESV